MTCFKRASFAVFAAFFALRPSIQAASVTDLTYDASGSTVTITGCNSTASGLLTIPATILPILFAAFAAYAFTFMNFRGRDTLFVVVVAVLVVPIQVAFQPMLNLLGGNGLNISGQFAAAWLMHTGFGMPLAIYTLRNYMATLPKTVIESAKIDGASHYQTFWRLILPMSVPVLAAFAILQFLWVWNDLLIAKLFLTDNPTVIVELQTLLSLIHI